MTDGEYDKTGLPDPLVLTYYFTVRDDRIVRLIIIRNQPTPAVGPALRDMPGRKDWPCR